MRQRFDLIGSEVSVVQAEASGAGLPPYGAGWLGLQVGLAGPSGSGKTAFSEKVRSFIPGCALLSMDNYNDASRLIDGNFDGEFRPSVLSFLHVQ